MRLDDFVISAAYFSIPIQIMVAFFRYPRFLAMPWHLVVLVVLFALFIFLCGTGHLFRALSWNHGHAFDTLNAITAFISLATALYLLPLIPHLFDSLDKALAAEMESKRKILTFMSFLCHEIRNPLFAITSTITFIGDDQSLSNSQRDSVECIEQSANLMLRLVNDVLDVSKLESGKLRLEKHSFDLVQMMEGAASSVRNDIYQKHQNAVQFQFTVGPSVPRYGIGDSVRILQVAYNLLSNAAKFTESGQVAFTVDVVSTDEAIRNKWILSSSNKSGIKDTSNSNGDINDNAKDSTMRDKNGSRLDDVSDCLQRDNGEHVHGLEALESEDQILASSLLNAAENEVEDPMSSAVVLKLQVSDTGDGISPARQRYIFEPYSQAKLSDYRKHGGTGLGLSIVSRLAEIMGGSIHLKSQVGKGSTFTFYVPLVISTFPKNNHAKNPFTRIISSLDESRIENDACHSSSSEQGSNDLSFQIDNENEEKCPYEPEVTQSKTSVLRSSLQKPPFSRNFQNAFNFPSNECLVLVVDDNAINRKILGRMLQQFNLECAFAVNGRESVDYIKASRNCTNNPADPGVGLILMDWSMPVMDGCEATRQIRRSKVDVPIVCLTACALEEGFHELLEAGSNEIATKPILRDDLLLLCQRYLS